MNNWQENKLGQLLVQRKEQVIIRPGTEYLLVTISNKGEVKLREKKLGVLISAKKAYITRSGDFIYSRLSVHTGAFGIVPQELDRALVTGEMPCFKIDAKQIHPKILIGLIGLPHFQWKLTQLTKGMGRVRIKEKAILALPITYPPLVAQELLARKLAKIKHSKAILAESLEHQKCLLKKLHQQILQDAIEGKLTADWRAENRDTEPASELLKRIAAAKARLVKSNKLKPPKPLLPINSAEQPFALPNGWVWCRLGDVIQLSNNLNIHSKLASDTTIHYVDIDTIDNKNFRIKAPKVAPVAALSSRARRILIPGYIVYSMVRPYLNNVAIVSENHAHYIGTTGLIVFRGINVKTEYLFTYLLSSYLRASHINLLSGFNSPSITQEQFLTTLLPLPPFAEQKAIAAKVEKLRTLCNQLETQLTTSQTHTNQLMQALLSEVFTPVAR